MLGAAFSMHVHGWAVLPFLIGYFIPTIVAVVRKGRYMVPAILVDVLLGWTIIGWAVALGLAIPTARGVGSHQPAGV